jgi:hypothetical protein
MVPAVMAIAAIIDHDDLEIGRIGVIALRNCLTSSLMVS